MRRHRAGSSGTAGRRQLPSPRPGAGWALRRSAFGSAATEEKARRMVRWPFRRAHAACADGGPSCGLPGCHEQAATPDRAEGFHERGPHGTRVLAPVSRPPTAVGKKLSPQRGGRRASLKHRARNAEVSAESRSTSSTSLGVARLRGTRVRFVFGWTRDPAFRAPSSFRGGGERGESRGRIPRRPNNRECGALATRAG
jgi:hypothetical protein